MAEEPLAEESGLTRLRTARWCTDVSISAGGRIQQRSSATPRGMVLGRFGSFAAKRFLPKVAATAVIWSCGGRLELWTARNTCSSGAAMIDWDELMRREGPAVWRTAYRLRQKSRPTPTSAFRRRSWRRWSYPIASRCEIGRRCCSGWRPVERSIGSGNGCDENGARKLADLALAEAAQADPSQQAEAAELDQRTALGGSAASRSASRGVLSARAGGLESSADCRSIRNFSERRGCDTAPHAAKVAGTLENAESTVGGAEAAARNLGATILGSHKSRERW